MDETKAAKEHLQEIHSIAARIDRTVSIMEVCGGHTNLIMKYGIRGILPPNIRLISGPGCPVCVTSQEDIDCMIELAKKRIPIATYGDMLRVPGTASSLEDERAIGASIYEVYSAEEVLRIREKHPDVIFFGVGFETTAPMTAFLLSKHVTVYSVHKIIPPALSVLADKGRVDGFLDPGHVSAIIGIDGYRSMTRPQVVAGFSAERILRAIRILLSMIVAGDNSIVNAYPEVVKQEGNKKAMKLMYGHLAICDSVWRGLGVIAASGLEVKDKKLDARIRYKLAPRPRKEIGCRCGEILMGLLEPHDCPLYMTTCTPEKPQGACMVSSEGSCSISSRYGVRK